MTCLVALELGADKPDAFLTFIRFTIVSGCPVNIIHDLQNFHQAAGIFFNGVFVVGQRLLKNRTRFLVVSL